MIDYQDGSENWICRDCGQVFWTDEEFEVECIVCGSTSVEVLTT